MADSNKQSRIESKLRWKTLREVGLLLSAGLIAIAALWLLRRPPVPPLPVPPLPQPGPQAQSAPPPAIPAGVSTAPSQAPVINIYDPDRSLSITLGTHAGVNEIHDRPAPDPLVVEFMQLLKQRDPAASAWITKMAYDREAQQLAGNDASPDGKYTHEELVGQSDFGMPIHEGETVVVPAPPKLPPAELEARYQEWYRPLRANYDKAMWEKQNMAALLARRKQPTVPSASNTHAAK